MESAMIFPLVVMSVISLIFIMIYFHIQLCDRVDMHIMLRAESGDICGNLIYGNEVNTDIPVYKKTDQIYSRGYVESGEKLLLLHREKAITARKYLINEGEFIRMTGIIGNGLQ